MGALILAFLLVFQPGEIRNQLHAISLELQVALEIGLPRFLRRVGSMLSGAFLYLEALLFVLFLIISGTVWYCHPELMKDQLLMRLFLAVGLVSPLFAIWNRLHGYMRRVRGHEDDPDAWEHPYALRPWLSKPVLWLVFSTVSWLVLGFYLTRLGLPARADDRLIFGLGGGAFVLGWLHIKVLGTIAGAFLDLGFSLGEFVLTVVLDLPGIPATIRTRIPAGGFDIVNEDRMRVVLTEGPDVLITASVPWFVFTLWVWGDAIDQVLIVTTLITSGVSLVYMLLGEVAKVQERTKNTIGWIWKHGTWISLVVFILGAIFREMLSAAFEYGGNVLSGITPYNVLTGRWWHYILTAMVLGLVAKIIWSVCDKKVTHKLWKYAWKIPFFATLIVILECIVAPLLIMGGHREWSLPKRYPSTTLAPVGLEVPVATFRDMDKTGKQELVITVMAREKNAKGVVEFPQESARRLGITKFLPAAVDDLKAFNEKVQVPLRRSPEAETCGTSECWRYEAVVPSLKGDEFGRYAVVMRNAPYGQVEEKLDQPFGNKLSSTP